MQNRFDSYEEYQGVDMHKLSGDFKSLVFERYPPIF